MHHSRSLVFGKVVPFDREHAGLGQFDFAFELKRSLSTPQLDLIQSLFRVNGFRCELINDKKLHSHYVLFIAYDNALGILKQAEKEHIFKKKYKDLNGSQSLESPGSKLRALLRRKTSEKLNPMVSELEQTASFIFAKRRNFIPNKTDVPTSDEISEDEPIQDYIEIFTQSELVRIIWSLIQSIQLNNTDSSVLEIFKIQKNEEDEFATHRLVDFLMREDLLEAATPLHTQGIENSTDNTDKIADYYGHNVSIYFKFMNFYTKWLIVPAIFGILRQIILFFDPQGEIVAFELDTLYCIMIVIWATLFIKYWRQTSSGICTKWNASGSRFKASDTRFDFKGVLGINLVTELPEFQHGGGRRAKLYLKSFLAHLPLMAVSATLVILFLNVLGYIDSHHWVYVEPLSRLAQKGAILDKNTEWAYIPTILQSLTMNILAIYNKKLAAITTRWENHRTNTAFNNAMIFKRFFFEIINTFTPLLYIGFWRLELGALRDELFALYTTDEIRRLVTEMLIPYVQKRLATPLAKKDKEKKLTQEEFIQEKLKELDLAEYDNYDDYLEMIIQFGYITIFATAFPLSGVFSLVFNYLEKNSDSIKLKHGYRRPIPTIVNGIGSWQSWINFMSHICLVTNTILIAYSSTLKNAVGDEAFKNDECEQYKLLVIAFFVEHLVFVAVYIIRKKVKNDPSWVTVYKQRSVRALQ